MAADTRNRASRRAQGRLIGYARVSTDDQATEAQEIELRSAGCDVIVQEHGSGASRARPALAKLTRDIAAGDTLIVVRLDRLITDVSEASRLDDALSRARFEPVDLGIVIEGIVRVREERGPQTDVQLAFARPRLGSAVVKGDGSRLARALENLIDNAVSFSPPGGLVQIAATRDNDHVLIRVEDQGPGVPENAREVIFNRFHSLRPDTEDFGKHSGLGLAIARAIIDGHGGQIMVEDRPSGAAGACFVIRLPAYEQP